MTKTKTVTLMFVLSMSIGVNANAVETWNCPDGERARLAFVSGEITKWPNYTEAGGARVQRQYPKTAFVAQAKYVDLGDKYFGVCQYYNHIGLTVTFGSLNLEKADKKFNGEAYWRKEYTESKPENDKLGQEMLEVCMQNENGLAYPSINCSFLTKD